MVDLDISEFLRRTEKFRSLPILVGIFLVGFAVRYSTRHELLFDPDSYWWYQLAMYFSGIRAEHFVHIDGKTIYELAYHPTGRDIGKELLLLPYTIGTSYRILGLFGAPQTPEGLLNYMFFLGPFFGALTTVLAYFLGRVSTGSSRAGYVAAILYSFAHFAMTRNTAGDTGQESLGTFLLFAFLLLFIKATRMQDIRELTLYSIGSAISFVLAANTWGGTVFYWGLVASSVLGYVVINVLLDRDIRIYLPVATAFSIFGIVGVFVPALLGVGAPWIRSLNPVDYVQSFSFFAVLMCLFVVGFHEVKKKKGLRIKLRTSLLAISLLAVLVLIATGKFTIIEGIINSILNLFFNPEEKGTTGNTVAYYRSTGFQELKSTFDILLFVIPVGGALLLYHLFKSKGKDFNTFFLLIFMFLGIVSFRAMIRLSFFLAFIVPLYLGILFNTYYARKIQMVSKKKGGDVPSAVALLVIMFFLISPVLAGSVVSVPSMKYSDQGVVPWKDVGQWLKENTPEDALLIHWWDYGYHLQTFAERRTIVDGGNTGPVITGVHRNIDVAEAFTSPEDEFHNYIGPYNPEGRPIYVLVSVEEFGKSGAINYHASSVGGGDLYITSFTVPNSGNPTGDQQLIMSTLQQNRITTYHVINYGSHYQVWAQIITDQTGTPHPEWTEKLLSKLLPFNTGYGQGLEHFQLVYQNGYVYVYKYLP
jgi:dolichyl-diphosphooligosaccharide--protein glycosyltransferase